MVKEKKIKQSKETNKKTQEFSFDLDFIPALKCAMLYVPKCIFI